jgi:hypothetical protein
LQQRSWKASGHKRISKKWKAIERMK